MESNKYSNSEYEQVFQRQQQQPSNDNNNQQQYSPTNYYGFNYNYQYNNYMQYYNNYRYQQAASTTSPSSYNNTLSSSSNTSQHNITPQSSSSSYSLSNSFFNSSLNTSASPQPTNEQNNYYYDQHSLKSDQFTSPKSYSYNTQSAFLSANYTPSITSNTSSSHFHPMHYSTDFAITSTPYQPITSSNSNNNNDINDQSIDDSIESIKLHLSNINSVELISSSSPSPNIQSATPANTTKPKSSKRPKVIKLDISQTNIGFGKVKSNQSTSNILSNKSFQCTECPASFSIAAKLFMHQHKNHKNRSSTECPICYKKFNSPANALVHLRAHTQEKTYKCEECSLAFCDSSTLKKHIRTHTGEKPYQCHLCSKSFAQSGNLKRHLAVHEKYDAIQGVVHPQSQTSLENITKSSSHSNTNSTYNQETCLQQDNSSSFLTNEQYLYYTSQYNNQSYQINN